LGGDLIMLDCINVIIAALLLLCGCIENNIPISIMGLAYLLYYKR